MASRADMHLRLHGWPSQCHLSIALSMYCNTQRQYSLSKLPRLTLHTQHTQTLTAHICPKNAYKHTVRTQLQTISSSTPDCKKIFFAATTVHAPSLAPARAWCPRQGLQKGPAGGSETTSTPAGEGLSAQDVCVVSPPPASPCCQMQTA